MFHNLGELLAFYLPDEDAAIQAEMVRAMSRRCVHSTRCCVASSNWASLSADTGIFTRHHLQHAAAERQSVSPSTRTRSCASLPAWPR